MINDSIETLRLNAEFDALIHAARPLLTTGEADSQKATQWISILSKPVHSVQQAKDRVLHARQLLRKLKSKQNIDDPPMYQSPPRNTSMDYTVV